MSTPIEAFKNTSSIISVLAVALKLPTVLKSLLCVTRPSIPKFLSRSNLKPIYGLTDVVDFVSGAVDSKKLPVSTNPLIELLTTLVPTSGLTSKYVSAL